MAVIVYTKPDCPHCEKTKNLLNELNVDYDLVDIFEYPEARDLIISWGFKAAPVVSVDSEGITDRWSGFNQAKIEEHFGTSSQIAPTEDEDWDF